MSDLSQRISQLSPKRLALVALELEARLEAAERSARDAREPIAIVGMACRFPGGVRTPEAFWDLLDRGVDAIREVPADRWDIDALYDPNPDAPGTMSTRWGGFVDEVDRFDADFFGISRREAQSMDPQQRLLLEVAWEAIEAAGLAPDALRAAPTGAFVGICNSDYGQMLMTRGLASIDAYLASGNALSVASGRLSYVLGLQGPSVSVDTACSSSLVAVHLACQSLRGGECRAALAAGVNLVLSPETTVALSKSHMMAPDGRCKAFDEAANGFVRGEGCGVVVLKRLADARADGDRILAVIRGSAINQDGRSSGLTAPNGPSQESVIRAALAAAGAQPDDLDYVEAHGTGTSLGDPIEMRALGAALGRGRAPERPLLVGSVKTNIGHLESAAGIAGLIKTVLALQHEALPPHLHFHTPSSHIPWASLPVAVTTTRTAWSRGARPRLAGVSSFGFSGTNAHIIVSEAPIDERAPEAPSERPLHVLTLSAKSEEALRQHATRVAAALRAPSASSASLGDACWTANVGRAHFGHRLAAVATTADEAASAIEAFADGRSAPGLVAAEAPPDAAEVAFLFTGQGAQYAGMGRRLYEASPVFRDAIDRCDAQLASVWDRSLADLLFRDETGRIDQTAFTQPAIFALEYALAEVWRAWGVRPAMVMGHSVGEIAAACVAGVMSLDDAIRLVAARSRLMQALPADGRMTAVFAPLSAVEPLVRERADAVSVAAINGPEHVVISGRAADVDAIGAALLARGIKSQPLTVSHAFHSPLMAPMVEPFRRELSALSFAAPRLGLVSNVTGDVVPVGEALDADYWCRHVMAPVSFSRSVDAVVRAGHRVVVEIGPAPVLIGMARRLPGADAATWIPTLRKGHDDARQMLSAAALLHVHGATIDWRAVDGGAGRRRVALPTYPFQRQRFWISAPAPQPARVAARKPGGTHHPLLGSRVDGPIPAFESYIDPRTMPGVSGHRVAGADVVPGPVYVELIAAAASQQLGTRAVIADDFVVREAIRLTDGEPRRVQTVVKEHGHDHAAVQVFSASGREDAAWTMNAAATVRAAAAAGAGIAPLCETVADVRARCTEEIAGDEYRARLQQAAIGVDDSLRPIERLWRRDGEALASLRIPDALANDAAMVLPPIVLDAAMLTIGAAMPATARHDGARVMSRIDRVALFGPPSTDVRSHVRITSTSRDGAIVADLDVRDETRLIAALRGIHIVPVAVAAASRTEAEGGAIDELLYDVSWEPLDSGASACDRLPPAAAIVDEVAPRFAELAETHALAEYETVLPQLDRACAAYVARALADLGVDLTPGATFDAATIAAARGVLPKHRRLLDAMLAMLAEDGILSEADARGNRLVRAAFADEDPAVRCARVAAAQPAYAAQARLLAACGAALAGVLRGDVDPLHVLFPNGSFELTEALYQRGPFATVFNTLASEVVARAAVAVPPGRTLRCLEIGAGTGGSSAAVLPVLPPERTEYWYTDVSPLFLTRAREKFATFPFVRYELLDIERDPESQGVPHGRFDLVFASNALHATADLRATMTQARKLLAPGGLLMLLEGTERQRWVDLTFGLLEGWWKFTDVDRRPSYPLLTQDGWRALLEETAFVDVATIPRERARQAVVIARAPSRVASLPSSGAGGGRTWIVAGAATDALADAVVTRLHAANQPVHRLPADVAARTREMAEMLDAGVEPVEILHVSRTRHGAAGEVVASGLLAQALADIATLAREIADAGNARRVRLWLVTSGAEGPTDDRAVQPLQSAEWGLGRVIALEHPDRWGGVIDVDPAADDAESAAAIIDAVLANGEEDQIAIRDGRPHAPRLVRARAETAAPALRLRPDATYLITGGTGGLAMPITQWMVDHGAKHLLLVSRHGMPNGDAALDERARRVDRMVRDLERQGARVEVVACDVADETAMARLIGTCGVSRPALRGVVHAAAAMSEAPVRALDDEALRAMLGPKVLGAELIDRLTREIDLDFLVFFSSTTALLGVAGLGHYAAANAYLDALAVDRVRRGLPALSVNWGTWDEMRLASDRDRRFFAQMGLEPLSSAAALDRLGALIARGVPRKVVAAIDWAVLKPVYEAKRRRPLLREVEPLAESRARAVGRHGAAVAESAAASASPPDGILDRLRREEPSQRRGLLLAHVAGHVAAVLGTLDAESVPVERGLFEMGMDSLMSVELKNRLESGLAHPLPSTLTFNYPNVNALVDFLLRELDLETSPAPARAAAPAEADADDRSEDDIAALLADQLRDLQGLSAGTGDE